MIILIVQAFVFAQMSCKVKGVSHSTVKKSLGGGALDLLYRQSLFHYLGINIIS